MMVICACEDLQCIAAKYSLISLRNRFIRREVISVRHCNKNSFKYASFPKIKFVKVVE